MKFGIPKKFCFKHFTSVLSDIMSGCITNIKKFIMVILHWKQVMLCDKKLSTGAIILHFIVNIRALNYSLKRQFLIAG